MKLTATSLVLVLSANLISFPANAVTVQTNVECAEWAEYREGTSSAKSLMEGILIGTFNGFAMASGKDFWESLELQQAFSWMDSYCDNNPLKYMHEGAIELMTKRVGTDW